MNVHTPHAARPTWLGTNLTHYRILAGLNQIDLATLAGVHHTSICNWETGRTNPSRTKLEQIAHALDVPIEHLTRNPAKRDVMKITVLSAGEAPELTPRTANKVDPISQERTYPIDHPLLVQAVRDMEALLPRLTVSIDARTIRRLANIQAAIDYLNEQPLED